MSLCMISAITRARRWDDDSRRIFWKFSGGAKAKANATRGAQHLREFNCHEQKPPESIITIRKVVVFV